MAGYTRGVWLRWTTYHTATSPLLGTCWSGEPRGGGQGYRVPIMGLIMGGATSSSLIIGTEDIVFVK